MPAQDSGNHSQVINVVTLTEKGWLSQPRQPQLRYSGIFLVRSLEGYVSSGTRTREGAGK